MQYSVWNRSSITCSYEYVLLHVCGAGVSYVKVVQEVALQITFFHIPEIEMKEQRGNKNCLRSHSKLVAKLEWV